MNSLLIRQLIQLGMLVESAPGVAIEQLQDIYEQQASADEAQMIHTAITELIDQFSKMGFAQENFRFAQKTNLFNEACNVLIDNMPLQTSKSNKREFLRNLGNNSATAYFVAMLSGKYGLEHPYFPFDWAKNIYHLMGFHLSNPSQNILKARVHFWNVLFQLSETKLPPPHRVDINGN